MNKKIYALMLTAPLLFSACNSTAVTPKVETEVKTKPVIIKTETKEVKIPLTTTTNSKDTLVTHANDKKIVRDEGMMHIESFMETLKPTLMGLMKSDKTNLTAMGGCSSMAMSMTQDYNNISDTKIRRTALKYRNAKNKPDATDTVVMEGFISSKDLKKPVVIEMSDHYRVYKALAIEQPCLACHGSNITPDLTKMLERTYPKDMATNFKLGEFRGVIVAKVKK